MLVMSLIKPSVVISMRFFRSLTDSLLHYIGRGHILLWPLGKMGNPFICGAPAEHTSRPSFLWSLSVFLLHESQKIWVLVLTLSCTVRTQPEGVPPRASVSPSIKWSSWAWEVVMLLQP